MNGDVNGTAGPGARLLVNTIPKSGTYLVSNLLQRLGAVDSGLHFRDDHFWSFGGQPEIEVIADPNQFLTHQDFDQAVRLVGPGQFAVAHLADPAAHLPVLDECGAAIVFLVRNLRSCLVSNMRFLADPRRRHEPFVWTSIDDPVERFQAFLDQHGKRYLRGVRAQLGWLDVGRPVLRFEDLYGDRGRDAQTAAVADLIAASDLVDVDAARAVEVLVDEVIGAATRTFSGGRSRLDDFWSDAAEQQIRELGVPELNRRLGYDER